MALKNEARDAEIRAKKAAGASYADLVGEYRLSPARIQQILQPEAAKRHKENYKKSKAGKV